MKRLKELRREIECVRRKLDNAIGNEYNESVCYELSVELDKLIEEYITMEESTMVPMT